MSLDGLLLLVGLALIIQGGDWFVGAAIRVAEFLKMPRVVIGGTLVSLMTTSPEFVVSLMAGAKGESGLAVGNAIGSCVCNIGLILGITAALKQIDINPRTLRRPLTVLVGFALVLFLMTLDLVLSRVQGMLLLMGGFTYFLFDFIIHSRARGAAVVAEAVSVKKAITGRFAWLETGWGTAVQFCAGAFLVIVGSRILVNAAVNLATAMGVSSMVVGLTVVAIGTSLPELVTAITSARRSVSDLAVGNILGANIANLSFIVGTAATMHEVRLDRVAQLLNFPALLVSILFLLALTLTKNRITRREGASLLVFYGVYLAILVVVTLTARS
jgi:cation:H+ antiporter